MKSIQGFTEEYRWLSNFWICDIFYDGDIYPSVEHAYQAAKTFNRQERLLIKNCKAPNEAKKLGKVVECRNDWRNIKVQIMLSLLREKFKNPDLKRLLLNTGDAYLEETNYWKDYFWGICDGYGLNWLGKLLMEVRKEINEENV